MKNTGAENKYCCNCGQPLDWRLIDGRQRLVCVARDCDFVVWDNPVPVVAAIILIENHVLLARNAQWPPGYHSLITGYLESGEAPEQAVLREVKEETALDATAADFLGLYLCKENNQILMVYQVEASGEVGLNHELLEYRLIPPSQLSPASFGFAGHSWQSMGMGVGPAMQDFLEKYTSLQQPANS